MAGQEDLGFTFTIKSGEVSIFHRNKKATTLRATKAVDFIQEADELSFAEMQQLMARLTGNYKHGNERTAKNHPRNRR